MRIVIDTNVIASAIYFGGKPFVLLQRVMEDKVDVLASKEIVDEYEEIILRLQNKYPALNIKIPFQTLLSKFAIIHASSNIHVCRDPDDDKFISCALDGKCLYIVSGDDDLLSIGSYEGIEILTVRAFLDRFGE